MFNSLTTLEEVRACFHSEEACADYLIVQKWPNGFVCSRCHHTTAYRIDVRRLPLFQCVRCLYQASPIVGTVMEGSSTDLRKWFTALFLVSSTESGINALRLKGILGVTYKTAWLMLTKIRQSITQADASVKLSGEVHVDVAKCGPAFGTSFYLSPQEFPVLVGTATDDQGQPAYVKIQIVPKPHYNNTNISRQGIEAFKERQIDEGATVACTVGKSVSRKDMKGYPIFVKARKWIKETFHGLAKRHLQQYWDEFCWRVNGRLHNTPLFESIMRLCATTQTTTYASLIAMS